MVAVVGAARRSAVNHRLAGLAIASLIITCLICCSVIFNAVERKTTRYFEAGFKRARRFAEENPLYHLADNRRGHFPAVNPRPAPSSLAWKRLNKIITTMTANPRSHQ